MEQILPNEPFNDFVLASASTLTLRRRPNPKHFDGMGDVLMTIDAELSRASRDTVQVDWTSNTISREFAITLRPDYRT
jgi:hypothetical protein